MNSRECTVIAEQTVQPVVHPRRPQIGALTGLRFFAAMYVFCFHFGAGFIARLGGGSQLVEFLNDGYLGVSLFFVLSGFILTYTYRDGIESQAAFAIARFARIYPTYLVALLFALPIAYHALGGRDIAAVLVMVQAWTPYTSEYGYTWIMQAWTLSVEIVFYLCFPVLMPVLQRLNRNQLVGGLLLVGILIVSAGSQSIAPGSIRPDLPAFVSLIPLPLLRLPEFVLGMLACELFLRLHSSDIDHRWKLKVSVPVTVVVIVCVLGTQRDHWHMLGMIPLLIAFLLCQLSAGRTGISRFLASKPLQLLGAASYALYLLQGPIRGWVRLLIPSETIGQMLNPVVAIACSIAVYVLIEKPARILILRLFLKPRPA